MARIRLWALLLSALPAFVGCVTQGQRQAEESVAARREAGREISRICALPRAEREAEIGKVLTNSGMVIYCGKD